MVPPPSLPPPEPLCNICNEPCNVQRSAFCVKCKKIYVHFGCLGFSSTANTKGMIYWSCAGCTPSFTADLSALERITAVEKKLNCVDSLIREVTMLRNEIALIKKPEFPFIKAAKSGPSSNRNDSSSSHHSATVNKKRKADDFEFEVVQRKVRSTNEVKTGMNTNPEVIKDVEKPPKRRHLSVVRLSQSITASEMEEYCIENNVELLHIRQISKPEALLKAVHCVFIFDEEKVELPIFWPENVTVSRFYLNEAARDWLKKWIKFDY